MGYQALSADEPAGRGRGHRLIGLVPIADQSKSTSTQQPSKVTTRLKVRKIVDTTGCIPCEQQRRRTPSQMRQTLPRSRNGSAMPTSPPPDSTTGARRGPKTARHFMSSIEEAPGAGASLWRLAIAQHDRDSYVLDPKACSTSLITSACDLPRASIHMRSLKMSGSCSSRRSPETIIGIIFLPIASAAPISN